MLDRIKQWIFRMVAIAQGKPVASRESLAIIRNVTKQFGALTAAVLVQLIYQFPTRHHYKNWMQADDDFIIKTIGITDLQYFAILKRLEDHDLIHHKKDKKVGKLYEINFERLGRYQHKVPGDRIMVTV